MTWFTRHMILEDEKPVSKKKVMETKVHHQCLQVSIRTHKGHFSSAFSSTLKLCHQLTVHSRSMRVNTVDLVRAKTEHTFDQIENLFSWIAVSGQDNTDTTKQTLTAELETAVEIASAPGAEDPPATPTCRNRKTPNETLKPFLLTKEQYLSELIVW